MNMLALLRSYSWQELKQHPWRHAAAVVAVMLGVALAFAVQLINASALTEFSQAVRTVNGQADLALRAPQGALDEALYTRVAQAPAVALASPVLELSTHAMAGGQKINLQVLGLDALRMAGVAPALMPRPDAQASRFAVFAPATVFLNAAARQRLPGDELQLQSGSQLVSVKVAGSVAAGGAPLAVMDLGAAQDLFERGGQLSRIDVRLQPGADRQTLSAQLNEPGLQFSEPGDAASRVSQLSKAYRVNLTVLALVALFTGAFLVFSVLSLSVAKRAQQLALLGVLGLTGRERLQLVLYESLALGLVGSAMGLALGTGLAALALRFAGGDLGGGYFAGVAPRLHWSAGAAAIYGALGVVAAMVGGWWPARAAQRMPLAQTLKGLGSDASRPAHPAWSLALLAASGLLTLAPPVAGMALGAYLAVALLLLGGIAALPLLIQALHAPLQRAARHRLLPLLAIERAGRVRHSASVAVSGVVASLSLAVALTVMVASFRQSVTDWLNVLLPADLYARSATSSAAADTVYFSPQAIAKLRQLPDVERVGTLRSTALQMDPAQPAVALIARELGDVRQSLPLVGEPLAAVPAGFTPVYVSEAMLDLYGARPGQEFARLGEALAHLHKNKAEAAPRFFVAGVWRDYARQFGAVMMDERDFVRLTGDTRINDLALWLTDPERSTQVQQAVREVVAAESPTGSAPWLELSSVSDIRAVSLRIFDRSFAVTYWLQAVAIGIGLFGVAANFSAQVLARRKEFGLLAHLGLTRRQILAVVAGEGAAWTAIGSLAGMALGLGVAVVLVHVVNPQSFRWTMDLQVPLLRLTLLGLAVMVAGTLTAWLAGRQAAGKNAVMAVKEDW
jgi:putative ABC transport system permease protein